MIEESIQQAPRVRLGELIEECEERNTGGKYSGDSVVGVNISKTFIPTVADLWSIDLSKYKVVPQDYFACNLMHIGRDVQVPIAYNDNEKVKIVSPAYYVFRVKKTCQERLLPRYLALLFDRYDFDRCCWFATDSSIRGNLTVERFCEIEIPLPDIEMQRALVAIYDGLQQTIAENEALIRELESVCHALVISCMRRYPKVRLDGLIEECEERNNDNSLTLKDVRGISIEKNFIPTKANMEGVSLTPYKIVKRGWFCYVTVTSRNGERISIALYNEPSPAIVSSSYIVFCSKDENVLLPEYLFLFFNRAEFNRYSRFNSWGSARETFDFSEMCRVEIPLPPMTIQRSIAAVAACLEESRRIVRDAQELRKKLCPALVQKAAHSA